MQGRSAAASSAKSPCEAVRTRKSVYPCVVGSIRSAASSDSEIPNSAAYERWSDISSSRIERVNSAKRLMVGRSGPRAAPRASIRAYSTRNSQSWRSQTWNRSTGSEPSPMPVTNG